MYLPQCGDVNLNSLRHNTSVFEWIRVTRVGHFNHWIAISMLKWACATQISHKCIHENISMLRGVVIFMSCLGLLTENN